MRTCTCEPIGLKRMRCLSKLCRDASDTDAPAVCRRSYLRGATACRPLSPCLCRRRQQMQTAPRRYAAAICCLIAAYLPCRALRRSPSSSQRIWTASGLKSTLHPAQRPLFISVLWPSAQVTLAVRPSHNIVEVFTGQARVCAAAAHGSPFASRMHRTCHVRCSAQP